MKKYRVNVNGTQYDITLEVLEGEAAAAAPKAAPAAAPAAPAAKAPAGAQAINAPMPSTTTNQVGISAPGTTACTTGAAVVSVLVNASSMIYLTVCYALGPASTTS